MRGERREKYGSADIGARRPPRPQSRACDSERWNEVQDKGETRERPMNRADPTLRHDKPRGSIERGRAAGQKWRWYHSGPTHHASTFGPEEMGEPLGACGSGLRRPPPAAILVFSGVGGELLQFGSGDC